jgi:hypothetical protein
VSPHRLGTDKYALLNCQLWNDLKAFFVSRISKCEKPSLQNEHAQLEDAVEL